ncbi:endonuclease/exonuclease/phosphatase family protein [Hymenobacter sp. 102]|uniref:endonuclease/exonuclease/phosphatase family protein n=1 Tax=Hymenobacter sp. 102 TaxID=3403152 RepID=UPI003CF442AE
MNIGFWNIESKPKKKNNKIFLKDLSDYMVMLTIERQLDIICLAETRDDINLSFITKLNTIVRDSYSIIKCSKDKLTVISRYSNTSFEDKSHLYKSTRWTAHKLTIDSLIELNLFAVHFHSKTSWSEASLALECVNFARDILVVEEQTKCKNTILIGDFNMNPFENGLVAANGLNALSDLEYAIKTPKGRDIDGTFYEFFYNPMWSFFGDINRQYGTYYYRTPGHISHEWNIYDQIIMRPRLKSYLDDPFLKIIKNIGGEDITKVFNRPDREVYSDHLPVILKLKF